MTKYRTTREALEAHMRGEITLEEAGEVANERMIHALERVRAEHRAKTAAAPTQKPSEAE